MKRYVATAASVTTTLAYSFLVSAQELGAMIEFVNGRVWRTGYAAGVTNGNGRT